MKSPPDRGGAATRVRSRGLPRNRRMDRKGGIMTRAIRNLLVAGGAGERPAKSSLTSPVCASRLPSLVESLRPPCRHILKRGDRTVVLRLQRRCGRSVCQSFFLGACPRINGYGPLIPRQPYDGGVWVGTPAVSTSTVVRHNWFTDGMTPCQEVLAGHMGPTRGNVR
jgi:hypothetical protein